MKEMEIPKTKITVVTGDTYPYHEYFKREGWKWSTHAQGWMPPTGSIDMTQSIPNIKKMIIHYVRSIDGIRNRGDFTARIYVRGQAGVLYETDEAGRLWDVDEDGTLFEVDEWGFEVK